MDGAYVSWGFCIISPIEAAVESLSYIGVHDILGVSFLFIVPPLTW